MIKPKIHVLALLVALKCVHEHGVGRSCAGDHVALVKIAQTSLEHVVTVLLAVYSRTGTPAMNPSWHPCISLSGRSLDIRFASFAGC